MKKIKRDRKESQHKKENNQKKKINVNSLMKMTKIQASNLKGIKIESPIKSIGTKLLLIIFASIISCVLVVGFLSYFMARDLIEENVSEASFQTIKQVSTNLNTILSNYDESMLQVMINQKITDSIEDAMTANAIFERFQAERALLDELSSFILGNSFATGIALIPVDEKYDQMYVTGASNYKTINEYREADWFASTIENYSKPYWIAPSTTGILNKNSYQNIGLARLIKDVKDPARNYVMLIEINTNSILEILTDVDLGEGSQIYLSGNDNSTVLSPVIEAIGQPANVVIPNSTTDISENRETLVDATGEDVLTVYRTLPNLEDWRLVGTIPLDNLIEEANQIRQLTVIMIVIAAFIAIAIGLFVMKIVGKPLRSIKDLMEKGAKGNLTVRADLDRRKDEIGQLSVSFNEMMTQIRNLAAQTTTSAAEVLQTASQLTDASQKTAVAAKEIAIATDEIAGGASSLAVEAEKGTDLTNNMNSQMEQVITSNERMTQSAIEVESASQKGIEYMGLLIDKTGTTEEMTRAMVDKVNALQESTTSIVKILDVLNAVTKQTNILSLNATIEAARAGAAGKGFMVVADEIRKLAEQSKESIEVVAQITNTISKEIGETVGVLSEAYPMFQEQISSVKEANQIFLSVQSQMGQFKENLDLVTQSIDELNQSQTVLSDAMNNVSAVAEQSSATSEEVASLSTEQLSISQNLVNLSNQLDAVSKGLKETLSNFKIN